MEGLGGLRGEPRAGPGSWARALKGGRSWKGGFGFGFGGTYAIGLPVGLPHALPVESGHRRSRGLPYPGLPRVM